MNYFWVSIDKFGNVILKTIGIIIIARILSPENFGVFSWAYFYGDSGPNWRQFLIASH